HIENPKAAQFDALAMGQGFFHAAEHGLDRQFGLGLGDAGFIDHFVNDVELYHESAPSSCSGGRNLQIIWDFYVGCQWTFGPINMTGFTHAETSLPRPRNPSQMAIKSDRWIRKMAIEHDMINPFNDRQVRQGVISYGLSSYGYDLRVA